MRLTVFTLAALLLFSVLVAAAKPPELQATTGETSFSGWNCNPTGGPAEYKAVAYITNPYDATMSVNYTYYDYYSGMMLNGGRICVIPPTQPAHCEFTIPVVLGGETGGNSSVQVRLFGTLDGRPEQPEKAFTYDIIHKPTSIEGNVLGTISGMQARLEAQEVAITSSCTSNGVCCGMVGPQSNLDSARIRLSIARELVRQCRFNDAMSATASAALNVGEAESSYRSSSAACRASLSAYAQSASNLTNVNSTLVARAACGRNIAASRTELANAGLLLGQAGDKIDADDYAGAGLYLSQSYLSLNRSLTLSDDCPLAGLDGSGAFTQPTPESTPIVVPASGGDAISRAIGALGYIVIAAIIVVVGAALYVSVGKRHLDSLMNRGPRASEEYPGAPPAAPGAGLLSSEDLPPVDTTKIDEEFQDWLKRSEPSQKPEPSKKHGKKK